MPDNLGEWIVALGTVFTWVFTLWKVWDKLHTQVNNVGTRVNTLELSDARQSTEITSLSLNMQRSIDDRAIIRENVARNAKAIETIGEEMREDRLAVVTQLFNSEKAAAERDAQLREAIVKLETKLDMETLVRSIVRNVRSHDDQNRHSS